MTPYEKGYESFCDYKSIENNPYNKKSPEGKAWMAGWIDAEKDYIRATIDLAMAA